MRAKSGFTLVEILIVVVILGILAAIVIPQFTDASTEAKTSSLCSDLQTVRSQIELYKIQHTDNLPGVVGIGHATDADFEEALTGYTNTSGIVQAAKGDGIVGPYLQKIPKNAFTNSTGVTTGTDDPNSFTLDETGASYGWYFNTDTGMFYAADSREHAAL
jgi:general secretion pathway protein G